MKRGKGNLNIKPLILGVSTSSITYISIARSLEPGIDMKALSEKKLGSNLVSAHQYTGSSEKP